jgi:large subunit ribosomal protein LP2
MPFVSSDSAVDLEALIAVYQLEFRCNFSVEESSSRTAGTPKSPYWYENAEWVCLSASCGDKILKDCRDSSQIKQALNFYKFSMKYVAAYILLALGGNSNPTEQDLTDYLKKIDSEVNQDQVKAVVSALSGKSLAELSTKGLSKISAMSFGGSGPAPATGAAPQKAKEAPKEEPKVEEEAVDMDLGDMFG